MISSEVYVSTVCNIYSRSRSIDHSFQVHVADSTGFETTCMPFLPLPYYLFILLPSLVFQARRTPIPSRIMIQ
jgi:hypothetical protein